MNTTKIHNAVKNICDASKTYSDALAVLREEMPDATRDEAREVLLPVFSKVYACPTKVSTAKSNAGATVLDSEHEKYDACSQALKRTLRDLFADETAVAKAQWQFTRAQLAAAKEFLPLFLNKAAAKAALDKITAK